MIAEKPVGDAPTGITLTPASIPEMAPVGTTVGTLTATDIDSANSFTYALVTGTGDSDNAAFTLTGNSLASNAVFDYEAKSSYSLRVRCTDAQGAFSDAVLAVTVTDVIIPAPAFDLAAGSYVGPQSLTLTSATAGATIHYTLDGTTPSASSPVYSVPLTIAADTTVKTLAIFDDAEFSPIASAAYTVQIVAGADSDSDGLPDTWEISHNLDPLDSADASQPSLDPQANGLTNLQLYYDDVVPPTLAAQTSPASNAFGWNNTNVTIHFTAADSGSGVATVTPDLTVTYADPSSTNTSSSGINLDTLLITLDDVDVTASFQRFDRQAVRVMPTLTEGTHTWQSTISDYAGNSKTTSATFTATGAPNLTAPIMSALSLPEGSVTVLPDMSAIWLQATLNIPDATVTASVNGGVEIPLNRRDGEFGIMVPLDYGSNMILFTARDANGQNPATKQLLVERSTRFRANVSPECVGFANPATPEGKTITGSVSAKRDAGTPGETFVTSVTINGVTTTLEPADANGNISFTTTAPVPNPTTVKPLTAGITWNNGDTSQVPLGLLEGYEILRKDTTANWLHEALKSTDGQWNVEKHQYIENFTLYLNFGNNYMRQWKRWIFSCPEPSPLMNVDGFQTTSAPVSTEDSNQTIAQPNRDLTIGYYYHLSCNAKALVGGKTESTMTFRAPMQYGCDTPVLFTFEGVDYLRAPDTLRDLSQVKYLGKDPVSWDNGYTYDAEGNVTHDAGKGSVTYSITVDGGEEYTLDQSKFTWPNFSYQDNPPYPFEATSSSVHQLSFTGFHNDPFRITVELIGAPLGGLVVKNGDDVTMKANIEPTTYVPLPGEPKWYYQRLKSDGTWEEWTSFGTSANGKTYTHKTTLNGVFRIKAVLSAYGKVLLEGIYTRKIKEEYGQGKKGDPDAFGVAETQMQIEIRNKAKEMIGNEDYGVNCLVFAKYGFLEVPVFENKCNIFVAHMAVKAGAIVPKIGGYHMEDPPSANQWAGTDDSHPYIPYWQTNIDHWELFRDPTYPEPGLIVAHPGTGGSGAIMNKMYPPHTFVGMIDQSASWGFSSGAKGTLPKTENSYFSMSETKVTGSCKKLHHC